MGNQELRRVMGKVQDRQFDTKMLDDYEEMLWKDVNLEDLTSFKQKCLEDPSTDEIFSFSSTIDLEKSDIDDDAKRWNEIREQDWSTGYTTGQKKLEMLKQGDYKQVVIPTN